MGRGDRHARRPSTPINERPDQSLPRPLGGDAGKGPIQGTVDILERLDGEGHELHALTNWSAETFPIARERYGFLERFRTILVSGDEKLMKPEPAIFELMLDRIGHSAERCLFIDDSAKNIEAAASLGFDTIHFSSPEELQTELSKRGV